MHKADANRLTVRELMQADKGPYRVPIYQRNYAWGDEQIQQLIDDVIDAAEAEMKEYFIGTIVVFPPSNEQPYFEVVDGQQRLTTLIILLARLRRVLGTKFDARTGVLEYESRRRASATIEAIATDTPRRRMLLDDEVSHEDGGMLDAADIIDQYITLHQEKLLKFRFPEYLLDRVVVAQVSLPAHTDLNRYFEIMNTRGEQLQQTDIVKARLMHALQGEPERACFAWLWDACADMESYLPMSLARGSTDLRNILFGNDWAWPAARDFPALVKARAANNSGSGGTTEAVGLLDALYSGAARANKSEDDEEDNVRFSSVVAFPTFLLHVLAVHDGSEDDGDESEKLLDDKKLVMRFANALERAEPDEKQEWVAGFAMCLLTCRFVFDNYVVKREYTAQPGAEGDWSLTRLVRGSSPDSLTKFRPRYPPSYGDRDGADEEDNDMNRRIQLLQSALRVTYTSPRTMHWITHLLRHLADCSSAADVHAQDVIKVLENYARGKVRETLKEDGPSSDALPPGFAVPRIVFTYLDYLLTRETASSERGFTFRNSIEHFYPQNLDQELAAAVTKLAEDDIQSFGNLALVTVSNNSKFSNSAPHQKRDFEEIVKSSPKLRLMAEAATGPQSWTPAQVAAHHDKMISVLRADVFTGERNATPGGQQG